MKKIIGGKVYDTETAKELGVYAYSNYGDLNYICKTLYRKKTGEFFLHEEGGANTRYAQQINTNEWCGGEIITPLTYKQAQEWTEKNLTGDEYESIFGIIKEDSEIVRKEFSLKSSTVAKLKRAASERGITMTDLMEDIINRL